MEKEKLEAKIKELEEKVELYEYILDNVSACIYVNGADGTPKYANRYSKEMYGFSFEEVKEMGLLNHYEKYYHPEDKKILYESVEALQKQDDYIGIFRCRHKNGEWKTILGASKIVKRYKDGSPIEGISCSIDVSKKFNSQIQIDSILKENAILKHQVLIEQLTKREKEVIKYLGKGLSSKEIANVLFISFHTVESHRKNILKKLAFKNSAELVNFAAQAGLI